MDDVNQKWCNNCKRKARVLAKGKLKMCTERTHIGHVQIDRIALSDLKMNHQLEFRIRQYRADSRKWPNLIKREAHNQRNVR